MTAQTAVDLQRHGVSARVLPDEGGVLLDLLVQGRSVLAATPWANSVLPSSTPATTEAEWVERWRGGWQLCFPTAGQPNPAAAVVEGFHGAASQTPWLVVSRNADRVTLGWNDVHGLIAERVWSLTDDGAAVTTRVHNTGDATRELVIAEHLILGGEVLAGMLGDVRGGGALGAEPLAASLALDVPPGTLLRPLDYAGLPEGEPLLWPGDATARWPIIDTQTPARVTGLAAVRPQRIGLRGPHVDVTVEWYGSALPHALLWQELGVSIEHPWNGRVIALGIEPTSTPHGAGTVLDDSLVRLAPTGMLEWSVSLSVRWSSDTPTSSPTTSEDS